MRGSVHRNLAMASGGVTPVGSSHQHDIHTNHQMP